jgi:hypothetical protein
MRLSPRIVGVETRNTLRRCVDALARVALGELDGRLHRQRRSRRLVDDEAKEAIARLRGADLSRFHVR